MPFSLPVVNLAAATFECMFGRGCEGDCCQAGRPSVSPKEDARIKKVLKRSLPLLRPEAKQLIEEEGYLSNRRKLDHRMMRVVDGWCVFFNQGCVLHKVGAEDGDPYQYKPIQCAIFPLDKDDDDGSWYVRQWGYNKETWKLFCLNPKESKQPAAKALQAEIELAAKVEANGDYKPEVGAKAKSA
jgi:Fe-S-cluster containining protein